MPCLWLSSTSSAWKPVPGSSTLPLIALGLKRCMSIDHDSILVEPCSQGCTASEHPAALKPSPWHLQKNLYAQLLPRMQLCNFFLSHAGALQLIVKSGPRGVALPSISSATRPHSMTEQCHERREYDTVPAQMFPFLLCCH